MGSCRKIVSACRLIDWLAYNCPTVIFVSCLSVSLTRRPLYGLIGNLWARHPAQYLLQAAGNWLGI